MGRRGVPNWGMGHVLRRVTWRHIQPPHHIQDENIDWKYTQSQRPAQGARPDLSRLPIQPPAPYQKVIKWKFMSVSEEVAEGALAWLWAAVASDHNG